MSRLKSFRKGTRGATTSEYGIVAAFIAIIVVLAISIIGDRNAAQVRENAAHAEMFGFK